MEAYFAAGCFWKIEETFRTLEGVTDTDAGYEGGENNEPTYTAVCGGGTGHAETVKVEFDPEKVSYEKLLSVFWSLHDPTQKDGQGLDMGDQYRSVIFYTSEEQKNQAMASRDKSQEAMDKKILTSIEPHTTFYPAEEYHQEYIRKNSF